MTRNVHTLPALAVACMAAAIGMAPATASAQAEPKATVSKADSATAVLVVKSIDTTNRTAVLTRDDGETISVKAPPEARNFNNLKPGDKITATYSLATDIVLSAPNTPLPDDTITSLGGRTPEGDRPGGVLANQVVISGTVTAIDVPNHTLKLASKDGGAVQTVSVKTDEGRKAMAKMKVGDTITAYITESMLLSVEPAT